MFKYFIPKIGSSGYFSTSKIKSPLDLSLFRTEEGLSKVRNSLKARFRNAEVATQMQQMLQEHRRMQHELQLSNKKVNELTARIKAKVKQSTSHNQQDVEGIKLSIKKIKQVQEQQKLKVKEVHSQIQQQIKKVGNIVDDTVRVSQNQEQNAIIKTYWPETNSQNKVPQYSYHEICGKLQLVDQKRGQKVSGHRGYFLKGQAVRLALALAQYGLDFLSQRGYCIYQAPTLIQEDMLQNCCQLSTIEQDMYRIQGENTYLAATSEQSLASLFAGEVLDSKQFPVKLAGYSSCYRKEAGAHGKDIQGIFRVHQFEKVEQFLIADPDKSRQSFDQMMKNCQDFYQSLNIPYRIVQIVSGELNDAATIKYDLQGWYPKQGKFRELVSVSNCTDYQSRLLEVQYLGSSNQYRNPHMLNGTLIAIQRAITCFLENWQDQSQITIPEALQPYCRFKKIDLVH